MENYSNNKIFKFLAERSSVLALIFVGIIAVGVLSFTGAGKYLLGSLLNGVNINTPTNLNRYAYGENIGWVDFNPTGGGMQVGDDGLTGYAWGENVGWIDLSSDANPPYSGTHWGVNNSTSGCTSGYSCLSGYAYGENVGWVDFDPVYSGTHYGVKIDTATGAFSGYAYGENIGWVSFNGTGYGVTTDWRPPVDCSGMVHCSACTTTSHCTTCVSPYVLLADNSGCETCSQAMSNCSSCSDNHTCSACSSGYVLNEGHTGCVAIVNGECGSASGSSFTAAPVANLCTAGSATTVSGSGPWTWSCAGSNGGSTASCSATLSSSGGGGGGTNYYTINTSIGSNGSIIPVSANPAYGTSQTFTITPASGYQVADVSVDGKSVGALTTYTFSNITASHTISATFSAIVSIPPVNTTQPTTTPTPTTWCHDFNKSLGFAETGTNDVVELHTALQKESISYAPDGDNVYYEGTSKAVIQFQTKYNITPQTGYTGVRTRAKLNQLYGCTPVINSTTQKSDVLDYIKQNLKNIKQSIPQGLPLFAQPTTPPPSNLQPTQSSSIQTPPQNQNLIIQVLNKMLKLLKDLLDQISKQAHI